MAVLRVESNPEGNAFGLTSEGLWVPMRDLNPVVPFTFHGRELDGALSVAWVSTANALASKAPDQQKDPKLKLAKFQELSVLEQRTAAGHRWFRFASTPGSVIATRVLRRQPNCRASYVRASAGSTSMSRVRCSPLTSAIGGVRDAGLDRARRGRQHFGDPARRTTACG